MIQALSIVPICIVPVRLSMLHLTHLFQLHGSPEKTIRWKQKWDKNNLKEKEMGNMLLFKMRVTTSLCQADRQTHGHSLL